MGSCSRAEWGTLTVAKRLSCHPAAAGIQEVRPGHTCRQGRGCRTSLSHTQPLPGERAAVGGGGGRGRRDGRGSRGLHFFWVLL